MNQRLLRSVLAIPLGWATSFVGIIMTATLIAIWRPEAFQTGVQHSTVWLLVTLAVSFLCGMVGGFVTGVIAQRNEIKHAIGLVLFIWLLSICLGRGNANAAQMPHWYVVAGYMLVIPAVLLGGWLRRKQRILTERGSETMVKTVDQVRFAVAILILSVTFLFILFGGTRLGAAGVWWMERRFSNEESPPSSILPMFIVSLVLASILARRLFRKMIGMRPSLMKEPATI